MSTIDVDATCTESRQQQQAEAAAATGRAGLTGSDTPWVEVGGEVSRPVRLAAGWPTGRVSERVNESDLTRDYEDECLARERKDEVRATGPQRATGQARWFTGFKVTFASGHVSPRDANTR
ncbi:hypothetical protein E2C01_013975 [Portunus trituberculatus]|uniref:Uncharacterized protein n=1 Tax=Portunus trituberculatus TaxID=210409 RepID=A0A5B7DIS4_PORTR|nr:hypothetical protein [Portunus trituberculatus]